jgi:transmembrane sensor
MNKPTETGLPPEIGRDLPDAVRRDLGNVWDLLGSVPEPEPSDEDTAWDDLRRRLGFPSRAGRRFTSRPPVSRREGRLRAAIVGFLCLIFGVAIWASTRSITIEAEHGDIAEYILPDGSVVILNSGASMEYRRGLGSGAFHRSARRVHLVGEAMFDVVPDDRAFVVETFNARIEVRGTRFNVRAWGDEFDDATSVTLFSGSVRVIGAEGEAAVLDVPGASSTVTTGATEIQVGTTSLDHAAAWRDRSFVVTDRSVGAILAELSRRFATPIVASGDVDLHARMSMFYPRGASLETILHDLCLTRGMTYQKTTRGFLVER